MKITALVENQGQGAMKPKHGLALHIKTRNHVILFDVGPDDTLFENAERMHIDLSLVDTVIISHGHYDHGGALRHFLEVNTQATVYVQRSAFEKHSSKLLGIKIPVGLDPSLKNHPRIVLLDGDTVIDDELRLFTVEQSDSLTHSDANDSLYENGRTDSFRHEQNLVICEDVTVLVLGCGHSGIVDFMRKGKTFGPTHCIGGYHLYNPLFRKTVGRDVLDAIAHQLADYPHVQFHTCHCTGKRAYTYLAARLPNMEYLSCGDTLVFEGSGKGMD